MRGKGTETGGAVWVSTGSLDHGLFFVVRRLQEIE